MYGRLHAAVRPNYVSADSVDIESNDLCDFTNYVMGCTYPDASNFDETATNDDGSCEFETPTPARPTSRRRTDDDLRPPELPRRLRDRLLITGSPERKRFEPLGKARRKSGLSLFPIFAT